MCSYDPQPGTEWNREIHTCVITEVSRGLPNNASMFATEVILFVIILSGVYQRNSGRHILSTMCREVRGLCWRRPRSSLHSQGLIWLAVAAVVQLLTVVRTALAVLGRWFDLFMN